MSGRWVRVAPDEDTMTLEQLAKQTAKDIWGVRPDKQEAIILAALKSGQIQLIKDIADQRDEALELLDLVRPLVERCEQHEAFFTKTQCHAWLHRMAALRQAQEMKGGDAS